MRKKQSAVTRMVARLLPDKKEVKKQETFLCPHCGNSMAKTRNFCPHCQNFRNGHSELIRPVQGQFHY